MLPLMLPSWSCSCKTKVSQSPFSMQSEHESELDEEGTFHLDQKHTHTHTLAFNKRSDQFYTITITEFNKESCTIILYENKIKLQQLHLKILHRAFFFSFTVNTREWTSSETSKLDRIENIRVYMRNFSVLVAQLWVLSMSERDIKHEKKYDEHCTDLNSERTMHSSENKMK